MQLATELPQVTTGRPGMNTKESTIPFKHYSNLYKIRLLPRSQRITLPFSSPEAIQDYSVLNARAETGSFCLTENTAWSFLRWRKEITPLSKPTPTISTKGDAYTMVIFWSFYWYPLRNLWKENRILLEIAFTRTRFSWLYSKILLT